MSEIWVSMTEEGTRRYPMHSHERFEIMYYLCGEGRMVTERGDIPFREGTVIVMPPRMMHGSVSKQGFVNISVGGDFSHLFATDAPFALQDNEAREGETLARLIYQNRFSNEGYLGALSTAYAHFLLRDAEHKSEIGRAINEIVREIGARFADPTLDVTQLLRQSGYAGDYVRAQFRERTSFTPIGFLTKVRIDRAKSLLEIYGESLTVSEIARACGFEDASYFSRRFSALVGVSPSRFAAARIDKTAGECYNTFKQQGEVQE